MNERADLELCELVKDTVGELSFDPKKLNSYQNFPKGRYLRPYLKNEVSRLDVKFDIDEMRRITYDILLHYGLRTKDGSPRYGGISLQYAEDDSDILFGSVENFSFKPRFKNHNYSKLNELGGRFKFIYDTFEDLGIQLLRGRILGAKPGMKIPFHTDYDYRIHIPVWTNEDAVAVFRRGKYHMAADGSAYLHNGFYEHSAENAGPQERIHLVFVVSPVHEKNLE